MTAEMKAELPGAWQAMVRVNPVNGRKNIYAGAHASHVIGWHGKRAANSFAG